MLRQRLETILTKRVCLDYLAWLPGSPAAVHGTASGGPWPMILFLHGSGERGSDLELVKRYGLPQLLAAQPDPGFIVVAPQYPAESDWVLHTDGLLALVDEAAARFPVDPQRVYLTGLSMGGRAAWLLAALAPQIWAALAPVCGRQPDVLRRPEFVRCIAGIPTWIFHGALDPRVPASESEAIYSMLREQGAEVQLTIYPHLAHESWTETYQNPLLYTWFLQHRRKDE